MNNLNTIGDFIGSVFSTLIDKNNKLFKALFADDDGTGTIEKIFNDIEETQRIWCNSSNVYKQEGEQFEKTISYFSILNRLFDEDDVSFKERNKLLYCRNGDTVWGDKWNIVKMFKAYFKSEQVYIINNTNDIKENLLDNGDFEEKSNSWILEGGTYTSEACFSGRTGVKFENYGICYQRVAVTSDATYFIHFFMYGSMTISITDTHGRYWKPGDQGVDDFGSWVPYTEHIALEHTQRWEPKSVFFITDQSVSQVMIIFEGIDSHVSYLDYVRLFNKEAYPSFTLIAVFSGRYTPETMAMAPGKRDPMVKRNYEGFEHFSEGEHDADRTNYERLSFVESAALNTDEGTDADRTNNEGVNHFSEGEHDADTRDEKRSFFESAALNSEEGTEDKTDYKKRSFVENAALNSDEITNYEGFRHFSEGGADADKTNNEGVNHFSEGEHDTDTRDEKRSFFENAALNSEEGTEDKTDYKKRSFVENAALNSEEGTEDKTDYEKCSFVESAALNSDKDPVMAEEVVKHAVIDRDKDPVMEGEAVKHAVVDNDKDPVMADGTNDRGAIAETNDAYIEGMPLAPWHNDKAGVTVDYSKMSYLEQHHIFGADGTAKKVIYNELLEIVQAAGIISYIEIIIKDSD
jgi:hypothetical protein